MHALWRKPISDEMKTEGSRRTLPLVPDVEEILLHHKKKQEGCQRQFRRGYSVKYLDIGVRGSDRQPAKTELRDHALFRGSEKVRTATDPIPRPAPHLRIALGGKEHQYEDHTGVALA